MMLAGQSFRKCADFRSPVRCNNTPSTVGIDQLVIPDRDTHRDLEGQLVDKGVRGPATWEGPDRQGRLG